MTPVGKVLAAKGLIDRMRSRRACSVKCMPMDSNARLSDGCTGWNRACTRRRVQS